MRRVIEEGARTAIVPLGSIEYQGRHLPLGADALLADRVGQEVAERLDAVLAPTVRIGYAPQHDEFAGTITVPAGTLTDTAVAIAHTLPVRDFGSSCWYRSTGGTPRRCVSRP